MVENAGKIIVNYCPFQYIMFAYTRAFGSQFVSYGQIGLHLDRLQATFCPFRRSPQLALLALLPQKQDQLACSDFHLDPTRAHLAKRAVSVAGRPSRPEVVLQTTVYRKKSDHSECNAS